jgi:predicted porin
MKPKHILACSTLALATAAGAQSSVTITGHLDASVLVESGGAAGTLKKVGSGVSGPSRLIIRGTEDLGDGLSAGFHLEHGVVVDTGGSLQQNFWGRQSYLQLAGGFGTLQAGLIFTPLFTTLRDVIDPFRASFAGNAGNILTAGVPGGPKSIGFPNTSAANGTAFGGLNRANTLQYSLPKLGGITGELAYSFGEQATASSGLKTMGGSMGYAQGPLAVRLAASKTWNAAASDTERNALLGANYDFGVLRLYLGAGSNRGYGTKRSEDALIGASSRVGLVTLMASYARKNDKSPANVDASQFGLGAIYHLSRRTHLHASFAKISNDVPNTSPAFYTVSSPAGPGTGDRMFGVGIGHFF